MPDRALEATGAKSSVRQLVNRQSGSKKTNTSDVEYKIEGEIPRLRYLQTRIFNAPDSWHMSPVSPDSNASFRTTCEQPTAVRGDGLRYAERAGSGQTALGR